MKFYKRFPGDIQIKTGGLSLAEFGAYDRLLDHYYAMEETIAPGEVYSIARAMSKADRDAVDKVLGKYFSLDPDGRYSQGRAEEMIAEAQPKIEAARTNGKRGGRPKANRTGTEQKPTGFSNQNQKETQDEPKAKASQSQSLNSKTKSKAYAPQAALADVDSSVVEQWLKIRKEKRLPVTQLAIDKIRREGAAAGLSMEATLTICCENGWGGFDAKWDRSGNGRQASNGNRSAQWWSTDATIIAKGKEIGIEARPGESMNDLKGRIHVQLDRVAA